MYAWDGGKAGRGRLWRDPKRRLYRYDEAGQIPNPAKPHGAYFSYLEWLTDSPHADVGPALTVRYPRAQNPLVVSSGPVPGGRLPHLDPMEPSAGVGALRDLVSPAEFARLLSTRKGHLAQELAIRFPGPDYGRYYDAWELLEAYGAQLARSRGYDALVSFDPTFYRRNRRYGARDFSEYVALHPEAVSILPGQAGVSLAERVSWRPLATTAPIPRSRALVPVAGVAGTPYPSLVGRALPGGRVVTFPAPRAPRALPPGRPSSPVSRPLREHPDVRRMREALLGAYRQHHGRGAVNTTDNPGASELSGLHQMHDLYRSYTGGKASFVSPPSWQAENQGRFATGAVSLPHACLKAERPVLEDGREDDRSPGTKAAAGETGGSLDMYEAEQSFLGADAALTLEALEVTAEEVKVVEALVENLEATGGERHGFEEYVKSADAEAEESGEDPLVNGYEVGEVAADPTYGAFAAGYQQAHEEAQQYAAWLDAQGDGAGEAPGSWRGCPLGAGPDEGYEEEGGMDVQADAFAKAWAEYFGAYGYDAEAVYADAYTKAAYGAVKAPRTYETYPSAPRYKGPPLYRGSRPGRSAEANERAKYIDAYFRLNRAIPSEDQIEQYMAATNAGLIAEGKGPFRAAANVDSLPTGTPPRWGSVNPWVGRITDKAHDERLRRDYPDYTDAEINDAKLRDYAVQAEWQPFDLPGLAIRERFSLPLHPSSRLRGKNPYYRKPPASEYFFPTGAGGAVEPWRYQPGFPVDPRNALSSNAWLPPGQQVTPAQARAILADYLRQYPDFPSLPGEYGFPFEDEARRLNPGWYPPR